jgi:hypothetical protein
VNQQLARDVGFVSAMLRVTVLPALTGTMYARAVALAPLWRSLRPEVLRALAAETVLPLHLDVLGVIDKVLAGKELVVGVRAPADPETP